MGITASAPTSMPCGTPRASAYEPHWRPSGPPAHRFNMGSLNIACMWRVCFCLFWVTPEGVGSLDCALAFVLFLCQDSYRQARGQGLWSTRVRGVAHGRPFYLVCTWTARQPLCCRILTWHAPLCPRCSARRQAAASSPRGKVPWQVDWAASLLRDKLSQELGANGSFEGK